MRKNLDIAIFTIIDKRDMNSNILINSIKHIIVFAIVLICCNTSIGQTACFTVTPTEGCAPTLTIECDNSCSTGASTYDWSINDALGTTGSGSNPSFVITEVGTFIITLTVNGGSTATQTVTIHELPVVDLVADITSGCAPQTVQLTDLTATPSGAPIVKWKWDWGGPDFDSVQNPIVTYTENGEVDVELVVDDANGCRAFAEIVDYISIDKAPTADFTVSPAGSCETPFSPSIINNSDNSQDGGVDWSWNFGSGVTATNPNSYNPGTVTYNSNGTYNITLTADDNGCTDDTTIVGAVVVDQLVGNFTIDDNTPCIGQSVDFTDASNFGGLIYTWYVDGVQEQSSGLPIFSRAWTTAGAKNVCLVASDLADDCRDSVCQVVNVQLGPDGDFFASATQSCGTPFMPAFMSTNTTGATHLWTVSGGATISDNTSLNPTMTFNAAGNYTVTLLLTSSNGCTKTITKTNYINISGDVNVSITPGPPDNQGCAPFSLTLDIDDSDLPSGTVVTSVMWDLPGATNQGAGSPTEIATTYNNVGDYTATATINFSGNCNQKIINREIKVGDRPILTAMVTPDTVCLNDTVYGLATSSIMNTEFNWYFEGAGEPVPGGIGTQSSIEFQYEQDWATPFNGFMIGNVNGCRDTVDFNVVVNPPAALFTFDVSCENKTKVTFHPNVPRGVFANSVMWNDVTSGGSTQIGSFGNIGQSANFVHDFSTPGIYEVQLEVSSALTGCSDEITKTVDLLNFTGNSVITPQETCPGQNVTFFDNTAGVVTWQWSYGDGDTSDVETSANTFNHVYTTTGTYNAQLFTRNNTDCFDTLNYTIKVGGGIADLTADPGLGTCNTPFTIDSFSATPSIFEQGGLANANWVITTDDTIIFANNDLTPGPIDYGIAGQYTVQLTAFDSIGCSDDTSAIVLVGGAVASFNSDKTDICPRDSIYFNNLSLGGNLTYDWSFPGGTPSTSTDKDPIIRYDMAGNYQVSLTVTSSGATTCSDDTTWMQSIVVNGSGFDFVVDNDNALCPPLISEFSIVPTPQPGDLSYIKWYLELSSDFGTSGDELENQVTAPNIYISGGSDSDVNGVTGYYDVALVIDGALCPDSIHKDNFIFVGGPGGSFDFTPDTICAPDVVVFSQVGVTRTDTIVWDFGGGQVQTHTPLVDNIPITYNAPGVYEPFILLKTEECPAVKVDLGRDILVSNVNAGAILDNDFICDDGVIMFTDSSIIDSADNTGDQIAISNWNFGDGVGTSTDLNPTYMYTGNVTGNLTVTHQVTTEFGCTDNTTLNVKVYDTPNGMIDDPGFVCAGGNISLNASGADNYTWETTGSATIINGNSSNPTILSIDDTTEFTVFMFNDTMVCADTQSVIVNVIDKIRGLVGPDAQICSGESVELLAEVVNLPSTSQIEYSWFPPVGLSNPNIANPIASPGSTAIYTVTFSSAGCDPDVGNVTIEVSGATFVEAGEDQIVTSGETVDLAAFSPAIVTYNWFDEDGNFINNTQSISAGPITETSVLFVEVGNGGCSAMDSVIILILEDCEGLIDIPNVFTPNGDGVNDNIRIQPGLGVAEIATFKVFNRWGEVVYETNSSEIEWDGTQNGEQLNPGVYVYYMELVCSNLERSIRKGNITLLK